MNKVFKNETMILILYLINYAHPQTFCSALCADTMCNSEASGDCTECRPPLVLSGSVCEEGAGYEFFQKSSDLGGALTTTMTSSTCGAYTFIGNISGSNPMTFTSSTGFSKPFYKVILVAWIILIDGWGTSQTMFCNVTGAGSHSMAMTNLIGKKVCGAAGNAEEHLKFSVEFDYNTTSASEMNFTFYTDDNSKKWGIKEFYVLMGVCNENCTSCFGSLISECYSCISSMFLSGTTCMGSCLDG